MDILNAIKTLLQRSPALADQIAWDGWATEQQGMADKVTRAREYADGDHAMKLTKEMREMLRLEADHDGAPFAVNHCGNIIATPVDRLEVTSIDSDNAAGSVWIRDVLDANRFDGLQLDLHEAAIEDGNTFLLVEYDNESSEVVLTHEQAYDGIEGVLVIYGANKRQPAAAIKVWQETLSEAGKVTTIARINLYWPDRVEKYIANGETITKYQPMNKPWPDPWRMADGTPIGVPVIHFRNDGKRRSAYGISILDDVIPIQDILNRTLMSMTMTAELTAFPVRYAIGLKPPPTVTPGMFLYLATGIDKQTGLPATPTPEQVAWYNAAKIGSLPQGDLSQYLGQAQFLIDQMYMISRIPMTKKDSTNTSGEALKQLEAGLLGRLRRLHVSFGNSWEDAITLAHRVQTVFGAGNPPEIGRCKTQWKPAEIRNDAVVIDNALKIADRVDERTFLEEVAKVYNWDADKIDLILTSKRGDSAARLAALGGGFPGMSSDASDNQQDPLDLSTLQPITEI